MFLIINWSKWLSNVLFSFAGIPRAPEIRDIAPSPGRVVLTVLTAEAGIDLSSPFFAFDVKVSNGVSTNYTFQFDGYLDNTEEELIIDDLEAGRYLFSVRSRNDFGASDFISTEDLTTVEGRGETVWKYRSNMTLVLILIHGHCSVRSSWGSLSDLPSFLYSTERMNLYCLCGGFIKKWEPKAPELP